LLLTFIVERKTKVYLDIIKNKILSFPIQVHRMQIETGWCRSYIGWELRVETEQQHWFCDGGKDIQLSICNTISYSHSLTIPHYLFATQHHIHISLSHTLQFPHDSLLYICHTISHSHFSFPYTTILLQFSTIYLPHNIIFTFIPVTIIQFISPFNVHIRLFTIYSSLINENY
jgi:hypothetical protein